MATRKEQVVALAAEGKTDRQIAEQLGISIHTVRYHRKDKRKIGMRQMVSYLYKRAKAQDGDSMSVKQSV